jgi:hypothetical protein
LFSSPRSSLFPARGLFVEPTLPAARGAGLVLGVWGRSEFLRCARRRRPRTGRRKRRRISPPTWLRTTKRTSPAFAAASAARGCAPGCTAAWPPPGCGLRAALVHGAHKDWTACAYVCSCGGDLVGCWSWLEPGVL